MPSTTILLILATCFLGGRALDPEGRPAGGLDLRLAGSATVVATTDADGYFAADLPDSVESPLAVEFWAGDRFWTILLFECDRPRTVRLPADDFRVAPVRIRAAPLELTFDGEALRVEDLPEDLIAGTSVAPSLAQAVQQLPGVGAVGRDGYTSAPTIRGLGRDRSLVLVEGVRLSSDRGVGPSASFLDPVLLGGVQVVRGISGVTYGGGALGGAILADLPDPPEAADVRVRLSGATNGEGGGAGVLLGRPLRGAWRVGAGGFYRARQDYAFPSGDGLPGDDARNSGLRHGGGAVILERDTDAVALRLSVLGTRADEVGRPTSRAGRLDTIEEEEHLLASLRLSRVDGAGETEALVGYHRPRTLNRTERFDGEGLRTRTGWTENVSHDATAALRLQRRRGEGTWIGGLDGFARWDVDAAEENRFFDAGDPSGTGRVDLVQDAARADLGLYAGWRRPVRLRGELSLLARLDWLHRSAEGQPSTGWFAPSIDLRGVYPLDTRWAVTAGLGYAFRAPRIQELYFEGDRPGGSRLANPGLEPETAWALEAGLRWGDGSWSATATAWGMLADDLIVQLPEDAAGDTLRNENVTRARMLGAEVSAAWMAPGDRGRITLAYALVLGKDDAGAPLPDIPSAEVRLAGEWALRGPSDRPDILLRTSFRAGGAKTPVPGGGGARWWSELLGSTGTGGDELGHPGFARWDAGVRLRPAAGVVLDLGVTNILDSRHIDRPEADAYPQPGRSFGLEITVGG